MRNHRRIFLLALAAPWFVGASGPNSLMTAAAAGSSPISIDGTISDDLRGTSPPARLASSGHAWNTMVDYTFDPGSNEIALADAGKAREVAKRLRDVPSLRIGLDGPNARRVDAVRDALIGAGVASFRIHMGALADPELRADARVVVLVIE